MTNTSNLPVEALEVEYPPTVLRYELVDGSGGAAGSAAARGCVGCTAPRRSATCGSTALAC
jgi:N-methylhydantoinase B/oxoprolinase/acetone carboxylase alpha subunit